MTTLLVTLALLAAAYALARFAGRRRHLRAAERAFQAIAAEAALPASLPDHHAAGAPPIVRQYLARAIGDDAPRGPRLVAVEQRGTFRLKPDAASFPFVATQHIAVRRPAFVWAATMAMAPGMPVLVLDSLRDGAGRFGGSLLGLVDVASGSGAEADVSSLLRYLAEAVWVPWALAPSHHLRWEPIDERSARATLSNHGHTVSGIFTFDDEGRPLRFRTTERYRQVGTAMVLTPWRVDLEPCEGFDGVEVPVAGTITWELEGGDFEVGRVELTAYRVAH